MGPENTGRPFLPSVSNTIEDINVGDTVYYRSISNELRKATIEDNISVFLPCCIFILYGKLEQKSSEFTQISQKFCA